MNENEINRYKNGGQNKIALLEEIARQKIILVKNVLLNTDLDLDQKLGAKESFDMLETLRVTIWDIQNELFFDEPTAEFLQKIQEIKRSM